MAILGQQLNTGPVGFFGTGSAITTTVTYSLTGAATQGVIASSSLPLLNIGQNRIWQMQCIASHATGSSNTNQSVVNILSIGAQQGLFSDTGTHLWTTVLTATYALNSANLSSATNIFPSPFANSAYLRFLCPVGMILSNPGAATDTGAFAGTLSLTYALYARAD